MILLKLKQMGDNGLPGVGFGGATIDDEAMGVACATELRVTSCVYAFSPSFSIWTATPIRR